MDKAVMSATPFFVSNTARDRSFSQENVPRNICYITIAIVNENDFIKSRNSDFSTNVLLCKT